MNGPKVVLTKIADNVILVERDAVPATVLSIKEGLEAAGEFLKGASTQKSVAGDVPATTAMNVVTGPVGGKSDKRKK